VGREGDIYYFGSILCLIFQAISNGEGGVCVIFFILLCLIPQAISNGEGERGVYIILDQFFV